MWGLASLNLAPLQPQRASAKASTAASVISPNSRTVAWSYFLTPKPVFVALKNVITANSQSYFMLVSGVHTPVALLLGLLHLSFSQPARGRRLCLVLSSSENPGCRYLFWDASTFSSPNQQIFMLIPVKLKTMPSNSATSHLLAVHRLFSEQGSGKLKPAGQLPVL